MSDTTPVDSTSSIDVSQVIRSTYAHYIIFGTSIFAMAWAGWNVLTVSSGLALRLNSG